MQKKNDALDTAFEHIGEKIAREIARQQASEREVPIPAIPVSAAQSLVSQPVLIFDTALRMIVYEMNRKNRYYCFSLCKETELVWTVMGSRYPEYIMITLDGSFSFFEVASIFPTSMSIQWYFSLRDIRLDIENAFKALYA